MLIRDESIKKYLSEESFKNLFFGRDSLNVEPAEMVDILGDNFIKWVNSESIKLELEHLESLDSDILIHLNLSTSQIEELLKSGKLKVDDLVELNWQTYYNLSDDFIDRNLKFLNLERFLSTLVVKKDNDLSEFGELLEKLTNLHNSSDFWRIISSCKLPEGFLEKWGDKIDPLVYSSIGGELTENMIQKLDKWRQERLGEDLLDSEFNINDMSYEYLEKVLSGEHPYKKEKDMIDGLLSKDLGELSSRYKSGDVDVLSDTVIDVLEWLPNFKDRGWVKRYLKGKLNNYKVDIKLFEEYHIDGFDYQFSYIDFTEGLDLEEGRVLSPSIETIKSRLSKENKNSFGDSNFDTNFDTKLKFFIKELNSLDSENLNINELNLNEFKLKLNSFRHKFSHKNRRGCNFMILPLKLVDIFEFFKNYKEGEIFDFCDIRTIITGLTEDIFLGYNDPQGTNIKLVTNGDISEFIRVGDINNSYYRIKI